MTIGWEVSVDDNTAMKLNSFYKSEEKSSVRKCTRERMARRIQVGTAGE